MKDVCENSRKELLFAYLDIRSEKDRNLKVRAYAELILKSIFLNDEKRWADLGDIKNMVEKFSGISKIPNKSIINSLNFLTNEIEYLDYGKKNKKWKIKNSKFKNISDNIDDNRKHLDSILENFLSSEMNAKVVRGWFLYICEIIFSREEEEFLRAIANKNNQGIKEFKIDDELKKSISEYSLEMFEENLISAFNVFIKNLSDEDSKFLLLLSQNIITSKIVAIDLDVDSLFAELIKDCVVLIDTNVFITQILSEEKLDDLFTSLKSLGAKFYFITKTKEEFERVVDAKKESMMSIAEKGLTKIRFNDEFYEMASSCGCRNRDDIERFFVNNLLPFPPDIGSEKINELKNEEYAEIEKKIDEEVGLANSTRYANLIQYKSKNILTHDLLLNDVAIELRRKKEKAIILTKDGVMQDFSIKNMKKGDKLSHWVHLKSMLSIISASMPYKKGFAKIFKSILKDSCCMQGREGFNLEDVRHLMNSANEIKIEECSKINECVEVVRKHRLMGNDANSEELKRALDDIITREQLPDIDKIKHKLEIEKENKKREIEKRDSIIIKEEIKKIIRLTNVKFSGLIVAYILIAVALSVVAYRIARNTWSSDNTDFGMIFITIIIFLITSVCGIVYKIHWPNFQKKKKNVPLLAEEKVKELLSNSK